jgi:hypothetical protein
VARGPQFDAFGIQMLQETKPMSNPAFKRSTLFLFSLLLAVPLFAATRGRDQSYFTYDDGGTIIHQADDGKEVDARVNLPVYPGDDIETNKHGRTEIRLSDGNVVALDRSTSVHFRSILDSYDGDNAQTVIELHFGRLAVQRTDSGHDFVRLDTENASYVANDTAIYSVEAESKGKDRVTVLDGTIEVRTPSRTTRVRAGEEARVDDQGLFGLVDLGRGGSDEFERWFVRRAERYGGGSSRYLDHSLAYSDYDLDQYGSWVYASSYGSYCWRPTVTAGWRPYYHGYWRHSPGGALVWISDEPWGWVPYHYGRWANDPIYGWIWMPGYSYSPAWVYWMYGANYVGWAPAGWYDCYRPYYDWAYRPYLRAGVGFDVGFGWGYGRVRVGEVDLRPWTFLPPGSLVASRVDRAALTTDVIRGRLQRDPSAGFATVSSNPARFTHSELRDPASAVNNIIRRGVGSGTGKEGSGSAADMTPFFRRDPEISSSVRERIVRSRPTLPVGGTPGSGVSIGSGAPSGVPSPGTSGTLEGRIDRGDGSASRGDTRWGTVPRGTLHGRDGSNPSGNPAGTTIDRSAPRDGENPSRDERPSWRDHVDRSRPSPGSGETPQVDRNTPSTNDKPRDDWRTRVNRGGDTPRGETPRDETPRASQPERERGSDIPRRIIDRIGGARISGGDGGSSSSGKSHDGGGSSSGGSSSSGKSHDSGSSSSGGSRSTPPPSHSSPPPSHDSGSHSNGNNGGGHVKRN